MKYVELNFKAKKDSIRDFKNGNIYRKSRIYIGRYSTPLFVVLRFKAI